MLSMSMPTYVYETIPAAPDETIERFEFRQGMTEDALQSHPDTGKPIRRVITGGLGYINSSAPSGGTGGGGGGC